MIAAGIVNRLAARLGDALAPPRARLIAWRVDGGIVGWLDERRAALVASAYADVFVADASGVHLRKRHATAEARRDALEEVARDLMRRGELTRWRNERYPVRAPSGDALFTIERAAARFFGIRTVAAHVNGVTERAGGRAMWIARRSATKPIEPGQFDNLVGGGVAFELSVAETVVKEAYEEAGIAPVLAREAVPCGQLTIRRMQRDGLHHDTIHVHDLELPPSFVPVNQDGEVAEFRLLTPAEAAAIAATGEGGDAMTPDASLVVADWLLRTGEVAADSAAGATLSALRHAS